MLKIIGDVYKVLINSQIFSISQFTECEEENLLCFAKICVVSFH